MIELNPQISAVIEGVIGRGVRSASIVDGDLILTFTDGGTVNVGHVNGEDGVGIASTVLNSDYTLTITLTNGTSYTTASIRGIQGIQGIQGVQGPAGRTAYQSALAGGYTGTEAQFNDALAKAFNAEAYAVGERGGTPVPSTDPTYHNNAKYYAEKAETAADEAASSAEEIEDLTVTASSLPAGSTPTVTKTGGGGLPYNITFGIPKGSPGQDGAPGQDGQDGEDGVSPAVTITQTATGHTVKITDKDHPQGQSFNVSNGQDGQDGQDGSPGADGITPTIGQNGNWYLGDTDTGKPSRGLQGEPGSDAEVTAENIEAALGYIPADEEELDGKQDAITDLATIRSGAGKGATALQPPASGLAVGKYFRVASINPLTLEAVDAPDAAMKIKLAGTAQTPGSDGYVNIPATAIGQWGLVKLQSDALSGMHTDFGYLRLTTASNWAFQRRLGEFTFNDIYVIDTENMDLAVKYALSDGKGPAWSDTEKTGAWSRLNSIKSTMDSVAVAGAKYYLGEQTAVSITMPTDALLGQEIVVNFSSGATACALTCDLTGFDFTPKANKTNRLIFTLIHKSTGTGDEDKWSVEIKEG